MTRSAGSVPDGRTRTRPRIAQPGRRVGDRPAQDRVALPLVLVARPDRALLLGQQRDLRREVGQRRGRAAA